MLMWDACMLEVPTITVIRRACPIHESRERLAIRYTSLILRWSLKLILFMKTHSAPYTDLSSLLANVGSQVCVRAEVNTSSSNSASHNLEYAVTTFEVSDVSSRGQTTPVFVRLPHAASLPTFAKGDMVRLENFTVTSESKAIPGGWAIKFLLSAMEDLYDGDTGSLDAWLKGLEKASAKRA